MALMGFGPRMSPTRAACLAISMLVCCTAGAAQGTRDLSIRPRFEQTFVLGRGDGPALTPSRIRGSPAGQTQPEPGEITIGLSTTHAVSLPKLHLYNRTRTGITIKAVAMAGTRQLATETLCGHVETDSWIVVPAETERVVVSTFAALTGDCP